MSDELPPTDPAPPGPPAPAPIQPKPPDVFVKGGTTSLAWDLQRAQLAAQSDRLRRQQDNRVAAVEQASKTPGTSAALLSLQLASHRHPIVVIEYRRRDGALNQECITDLVAVPRTDAPGETDLAFIIVCPRCLERTGRQDQSQIMVRQSVRQFWLDETKRRHWVNQRFGDFYQVAGNITTKDAVTCDALGCTFRFRVDDSKLYEV